MFKVPDKVPVWLLTVHKDSYLTIDDMVGIFKCHRNLLPKFIPPDSKQRMMNDHRKSKNLWVASRVIEFIKRKGKK